MACDMRGTVHSRLANRTTLNSAIAYEKERVNNSTLFSPFTSLRPFLPRPEVRPRPALLHLYPFLASDLNTCRKMVNSP